MNRMLHQIEPRYVARVLLVLMLLAAGCAKKPFAPGPVESHIVKGKEFVVVVAGRNETLDSLARRFLGDKDRAWVIADFNGISRVVGGQEIVIPLKETNPIGIYPDGYQTVPILCYHRFGPRKDKLVMTAGAFDAQMAYLYKNGYRVIRLSDLIAFLKGKKAVPRKAVVITLDDGYKSAYTIAYPILGKYGFPATIFIYTDYIGARAGLTWREIEEMVASGLIEIQPHSKSHSNLGLRDAREDKTEYRERVEREVLVPTREIAKRISTLPYAYAYPYGDTNEFVIECIKDRGLRLGVTVQPGGNPSFAYPFMLHRTMIFGNHGMEEFKARLNCFQQESLK
jgi:peptidoglycan/xylan/chitin deacetylase (PgdA/CDA1 family)